MVTGSMAGGRYGSLTDEDWGRLSSLANYMEPHQTLDEAGNVIEEYLTRPRVEAQLDRWISTGYITEAQAGRIERELDERTFQTQLGLAQKGAGQRAIYNVKETERMRLEEERLKAETLEANMPDFLSWAETVYTPQEVETLRQNPDVNESAQWKYWESQKNRLYAPDVEYGTPYTEFVSQAAPTERMKQWFRSRYPELLSAFEEKLPKDDIYSQTRVKEVETQRERSWTEYLKGRESQLKEEHSMLSPYDRGERPSAYAPRLQSTRF